MYGLFGLRACRIAGSEAMAGCLLFEVVREACWALSDVCSLPARVRELCAAAGADRTEPRMPKYTLQESWLASSSTPTGRVEPLNTQILNPKPRTPKALNPSWRTWQPPKPTVRRRCSRRTTSTTMTPTVGHQFLGDSFGKACYRRHTGF